MDAHTLIQLKVCKYFGFITLLLWLTYCGLPYVDSWIKLSLHAIYGTSQ